MSVLSLAVLLAICHTGASLHADTHNPLERIGAVRAVLLEPSVAVRVNSTQLTRSGQWFEVSWTVTNPSYGTGAVGLWVPAQAKFNETAPAKYKLAAQSPTHITQGKGSLSFRLINYRHDMVFAFMRGGLLKPVLAGLSPVIRVLNPNEPLQGHLALTGDSKEMLVQWTTHNSSAPVVKWGERPGQYARTATASSSSYSRREMCGPPATTVGWVDPGVFHAAKLDGLEPGKRYYYVFGDEAWGFSSEASFRAAPPVGPHTSVKFLAVADMGQGEVDGSMEQAEMLPSINTTRLMHEQGEEYQLLVHNGDISYGRGYVTQWDNFMHQIEPITRRMPYMVAPGNHERDWPGTGDRYDWGYDSGGECGVAYERRMKMPLPGPDRQWYSFDFGPIHFLQYSTEHDFAPGSEQYAFIEHDLASVDRSLTPWLILGGHRPMYISSNNLMPVDGDQVVAADLRRALEGLLAAHKVDLTLHGHHHSYQRTCAVNNWLCMGCDDEGVARAPVHLVIGNGGFMLAPPGILRSPVWEVDMVWQGHHHSYQRTCPVLNGTCVRGVDAFGGSAAAPVQVVLGNAGADLSLNVELWPNAMWQSIKLWWGYLRVEASGTHLKCQMVSDADRRVMDEVELKKPHGWGVWYMAAKGQQHEQPKRQQQQHATSAMHKAALPLIVSES